MIIAIDQSLTCTGICIMDEKTQKYKTYTIKPKKLRGIERLEFIKKELEFLILNYEYEQMTKGKGVYEYSPKDLIVDWKGVMEGYSYGSIGRTFELGELGGIIKMIFNKRGIPLEIVPPTVWKKEVVGKGNANKDKVKLVVSDDYGLKFNTQDECDAWCMAEYKRRQ